ncbi:MAG: PASTA domain-containing protein [Erysipelotrichaceae bacterium]|nr:PASTA domain-containing protein [Erysipelotrichaceae bacterium]
MAEDFLSQFSGKQAPKKEPEKKVEPVKKEPVKVKEEPVKVKAEPVKAEPKKVETVKRPESFKEEERTKIVKERKPVNKGLVAGLVALLVVLLIAVYFLFFAPKIEMPNFEGMNKSDVAAWVKQQGIETSGIIFKEEYDFDTKEGTILYQNVNPGKKVKKNVKLTFTSSLGADPNEMISVPDLKSMTKNEIKDWIDENKLTKTKITTTYSDSVETDRVISYEFSGVDAETFTRSSTLKISVSKGPQPAGTITVEDFKDKSYYEVETWAKNNKVNVEKVEVFDSKVTEGNIVSQSVEAKKTMKQGDTLTVYVSKGEGVKVPDLNALSKTEADEWIKKNAGTIKERYSSSSAYVLDQSIRANTTVSKTELLEMTVVINLGNGFYLSDVGLGALDGESYDSIADTVKSLKDKGININLLRDIVENTADRGEVISHSIYTTEYAYSDIQKLPLNVTIHVTVSDGPENITPAPVPTPTTTTAVNLVGQSLTDAQTWAASKGITLTAVQGKYSNIADKDVITAQVETVGTEVSSMTVTVSRGNQFYMDEILAETGFEIIGSSKDRVQDWVNENAGALGLTITVTPDASYDGTVASYKVNGNFGTEKVTGNTLNIVLFS